MSIFDLEKTDDLHGELRRLLVKDEKLLTHNEKLVFDFFDIKPYLSLMEIRVGFYRKHKKYKPRQFFSNLLGRLSKKNVIKYEKSTRIYLKDKSQRIYSKIESDVKEQNS